MAAGSDITKLKELLYRAETERLQLQNKHDALGEDAQQLTSDVRQLQQQLADAHSAFADLQQQNLQLTTRNAELQLHVQSATCEYRANDIICCHLRDQITKLCQQLADSQQTCNEQASQLATVSDELSAVSQNKEDVTQRLLSLQEQHQHLASDHASTLQQLHETQLELDNTKTCAELLGEVCHVRDTVMVLGKALGKQPRGQELPGHDDPIWSKLGPLGGVQLALEVTMKHIRAQEVRVREAAAEVDRLEDRVRSESAQKAELQAVLFEVRGLYAKAVADRESLDSRTARAEAEKAAAENNWQRAKAQAADDSARLVELQEAVLSLTKQVQQLLPWQTKASTFEVERDTARHKLDQLQEQYDKLQRQLLQATSREADAQAGLETYKAEHAQLLAANAQLLEQSQTLTKKVQTLEISSREGTLAAGQLEETRKRLTSAQRQLDVLTEDHLQTLNKLEAAQRLLSEVSLSSDATFTSSSSDSGLSEASTPNAGSAGDSSKPSWTRTGGCSSAASNSQLAGEADAQAALLAHEEQQPQHSRHPDASELQGAVPLPTSGRASPATSSPRRQRASHLGSGSSSTAPATNQAGPAVDGAGSPRRSRRRSCQGDQEELSRLPSDVSAMLKESGIAEHMAHKQKHGRSAKVAMLSTLCQKLHQQLLQEAERCASMEVELLQHQAQQLQALTEREQSFSQQCMETVADSVQILQHMLAQLQEVWQEGSGGGQAAAAADTTALNGGSDLPGLTDTVAGKQHGWMQGAMAAMLKDLRGMAAEAEARAQLFAARQDVAVQSDAPVQPEWLCFLARLPGLSVTHALHPKAVAEATVRIYLRALHQQGERWQQEQHIRQGPAGLVQQLGGGSSTLLDVMMEHYSQQQREQQRSSALLTYDAALWKDPEGPVCRLLLSCQSLASSNTKAALFCCLAGTQQPGADASCGWGQQHWHHFLLLLHAIKRLTAGSWKSTIKDWASAKGARLPLQCVHDLLGNVYNCDLPQLSEISAVVNSKQLRLATAAVGGGGDEAGVGSSSGGQRPLAERGSVSAALDVLVEGGPAGLSVDMDDLMAMIMTQFHLGLLPVHPLMEPRRLTDGSLANASNAWGTAAVEATGGSLSSSGGTTGAAVAGAAAAGRLRLNSPNAINAGTGSGSGISLSSAEGPEWPGVLVSASSGPSSRPTTGTTGRGALLAGVDSVVSSPSGNAPGWYVDPPGWPHMGGVLTYLTQVADVTPAWQQTIRCRAGQG
eukprot:gene13679-13801_t